MPHGGGKQSNFYPWKRFRKHARISHFSDVFEFDIKMHLNENKSNKSKEGTKCLNWGGELADSPKIGRICMNLLSKGGLDWPIPGSAPAMSME